MQGRRLAWSLAIATVLTAVPAGGALAGPEGVLPIAVDTTYADGTFVFRENLVVAPGVTLTFRNAVVFLDAPQFCPSRGSAGYCQPSILLGQDSRLRILDSVVDAHAWNEADFESGWTVAGVGASFEIVGSTLTHYESLGVQLPGKGRSLVEDSAFVEARGALSFTRGAVADVRGNTFQDLYLGVTFLDSDSTLTGNVFRHVHRDYGNGPFGRAIDVQATLAGEKRFEATTLVAGNLVEDAHQGMLNLNGFPNEIRGNVFRGNRLALTVGLNVGDTIVHVGAPVVTGNLFEGNRDALQLYTSGTYRDEATRVPITADVQGNAFVGTACTEVSATQVDRHVALTVDARQSWWGTADGPQDHGEGCPAFTGTVLAAPWLAEAP